MAFSYDSVRSQYKVLYDAGVTRKSLPDWAAERNALTHSNLYDEGLHDSVLKRTSKFLDRNVFDPLASVTTEPLGRAIGSVFGYGDAGAAVGKSLPRALVESAPLYLAGPEAGIPATVAALGGTGALFAAHTYADTNSGKAALVSGVTAAVLPGVGRLAGNAAVKALGLSERVVGDVAPIITETENSKSVIDGYAVNRLFPKAGKVGRFKAAQLAGDQLGQIAVNQASMYATSKALGAEYDPLSPEFLINQIPFTAMSLFHTVTQKLPTADVIKAGLEKPAPVVEKPRVVEPTNPEVRAQLDASLQEVTRVVSDPKSTPQDREAALAALIGTTSEPEKITKLKGDAKPELPIITVTGHAFETPQGTYKVLVDPARSPALVLPDHGNVFVNGHTEKVENPDGTVTFKTRSDLVDPRVKFPIKPNEIKATQDANQPDLTRQNVTIERRGFNDNPLQEHAGTDSVFFTPKGETNEFHGNRLNRVILSKDAKLFNGTSSADFVKAQGLWETPSPIVKELTRYDTLAQAEQHGLPDDLYKATQKLAKDELAKQGYAGAFWSAEDNDNVRQYQLWNKDVISNVQREFPGPGTRDLAQAGVGEGDLLKDFKFAPHEVRALAENGIEVPEETTIPEHLIEERPIRPAVKEPNGKITVGLFHGDALERAGNPTEAEAGWVTNKGRFLSKEETEKQFPHSFDPDPTGATRGSSDYWAAADTADPLTPAEEAGAVSWTPELAKESVPVEQLKEVAHGLEVNQAKADSAQLNIAKVPETVEEVPQLLKVDAASPETVEKVKQAVKAKVDEGATATQAVEAERLKANTPELDAALQELKRLTKQGKRLSGQAYKRAVEAGHALLESYSAQAIKEPGGEAQKLLDKVTKLLKDPKIKDPKVLDRVAVALFKWSQAGSEVGRLDGVLGKVIKNAQKTPSLSIKALEKNAAGKIKYYDTEAEATQSIADNHADNSNAKVQSRIRKDKKLYFVGERLFKPGENAASLNQQLGEGTATLGDVVLADPSHIESGREALPNKGKLAVETKDDIVSQMDKLISDPVEYTADLVGDEPSPEQLLDTVEELNQVREIWRLKEELGIDTPSFLPKLNEVLKERGLGQFAKVSEVKDIWKRVTEEVFRYSNDLRNFSLDSNVPHDEELVKKIGIRDNPIVNWLTWFADHPKSTYMGELVRDLLKATDLSNLEVVTFEHPDYLPQFGWAYRQHTITGQGRIQIGHFPINEADAFIGAMSLAHELAHHAGRDLMRRNDPAAVKFKSTLEQIKQGLQQSPAVPRPVRQAIRRGLEEGWFDEYQRGEIGEEELMARYDKVAPKHGDWGWRRLFYALQSQDELLVSIFDSREVVQTLANTKMPKNLAQTALQFFSRAWNTIFGSGRVSTDSALAELLQRFDEYLGSNRFDAAYTGRHYLRDYLVGNGVVPGALMSRIHTIERLFATGDLQHSVDGYLREAKSNLLPATAATGEIHPDVMQTLQTGTPADLGKSVLGLLAEDLPAHQELYNRMRDDLTAAVQLVRNIANGSVPGELPLDALSRLQRHYGKVNAFRNALEKQRLNIERWASLDNFTYRGLERTQASQLSEPKLPEPADPTGVQDVARAVLGLADIRRETSLAELKGEEKLGFLTRALMLTQFVKQLHPEFRAVADVVRLHGGKAIERITSLNAAYGFDGETGKPSSKLLKSHQRVRDNEKLSQASSFIKLWVQKQEAKQTKWDWTHKVIQKELSRFNQTDRDAIKAEFDSARNRRLVWTEQTLPQALTEKNQVNVARLIAAHEEGLLPTQARQLSSQMHDALALLQDPAQAATGATMLQSLAGQMQPETFQQALGYAQELIKATNKHLQFMRSRPNYVSEQRFDKHHVVMVGPNDEAFRASGKTREAVMKIVKQQEAKGYEFLEYIPKADANVPAGGVNENILGAMKELDVQAYNRLEGRLRGVVDDKVLENVLPETQRALQYEASSNSFRPTPNVTRRFVGGREYLNLIENDHEFYVRGNNWLRHTLMRANASLEMMHPELRANRTLRDFAEQHVDNNLTPDNPLARKLVEAVYYQRLAFSFGNSLLEGVQNLTTGMQALIAENGSVGDSFKLWQTAVKNIMKFHASGKWDNPEHEYVMNKAAAYGAQGLTVWSDIVDPDTASTVAVLSNGKNIPSQAVGAVKAGARKWATAVQRYNDQIGWLAGYDLARAKGMGQEDAFNYAWDIKERGYYSGGKAQRAVGLWSIKSKPVPQLLSSLNTYTLGWFSQMAKDWRVGFGGEAEGLTPTQRLGSRKAVLYGLGAQAVLAGALGLPGVGQGLAVLKQVTGVDLKGKLRASLASLFDEDQTDGGILTNLALRGAPAGVSPIDPSNRAAISFPFLGIDPYKGFDLAQLTGAPGAGISDVVKGLIAAAQGDAVGFQKLLPSVLKPVAGLIQGEGDVRDSRGALLQTLTPFERALTVMGLPPTKIQAARDTAEAVKNLQDAAQREKQEFQDSTASALREGRESEARAALRERIVNHPEEDATATAAGIARRVEAQSLPYDYRRTSSQSIDLHGLGRTSPASESRRLALRDHVLATLGVRSRRSVSSGVEAGRIDRIWESDPYLTLSEARARVRGTAQVQRRNNALLSQAFQ